MKINTTEEQGKKAINNLLSLTGNKKLLGKRVKYKNPFYMEINFIQIGNPFNYGVIKDYDGDYLIIENEITKQEEYINKKDVEVLRSMRE